MAKYFLVAAKPKAATEHLKSTFKLYHVVDKKWVHEWKSVEDVVALMKAGHEVVTGKIVDKKMQEGDRVEVELRIAHNKTDFKITGMPDV